MLLETIVDLFFRQHFRGSTYELKKGRDNEYIVVAVETEDDFFYCNFNLLDAEDRKFTVYCGQTTPRSFAYAVDQNNKLVDIKRALFSAREILHHLDVYNEEEDEIDTFLSDPRNIDLFYQKLTFIKKMYGNEWSIELNPIYEQPSMSDMFLSMRGLGMIWDHDQASFNIYNGHEAIRESSIDYTNGVVTINRKILFFILNPNATFYVAQYIPAEGSEEFLVYEGEIATDLGATDSNDGTYCRFTISNLDKLPAADILMEWGNQKIKAKAPLLLANDGQGGFLHFTLKEYELMRALDEIFEIVENNMTEEVAGFHLDYLREADLL